MNTHFFSIRDYRIRRRYALLAVLCLLICNVTVAYAHKPSDAYLTLWVKGEEITGRLDLALRDLDFVIGLDENDNGEITWAELRTRHQAIEQYVFDRLRLSRGNTQCDLEVKDHLVDTHSDGTYAIVFFSAKCIGQSNELTAHYQLFFDVDTQHRGILNLHSSSGSQLVVYTPDRQDQRLSLVATGHLQQVAHFLSEGIWHIWTGFDHILFLLALIIPAVLIKADTTKWQGVSSLRDVISRVVITVTAFTIAHSLTLCLAVLKVVELPSRIVESIIALSVALAATNNVFRFLEERRVWLIAFVFGLIHGFGFASVLGALDLSAEVLLTALFSFNLGVEVGQLAIVIAFIPTAFFLRNTVFYQRIILIGGSVAIFVLAVVWFIQRAFFVT